jgi:ribonuclease I
MKFSDLIKKVDEVSARVDLESVGKFIRKNRKVSINDLKKLIKKEFPKLKDDEIELAIDIS